MGNLYLLSCARISRIVLIILAYRKCIYNVCVYIYIYNLYIYIYEKDGTKRQNSLLLRVSCSRTHQIVFNGLGLRFRVRDRVKYCLMSA